MCVCVFLIPSRRLRVSIGKIYSFTIYVAQVEGDAGIVNNYIYPIRFAVSTRARVFVGYLSTLLFVEDCRRHLDVGF